MILHKQRQIIVIQVCGTLYDGICERGTSFPTLAGNAWYKTDVQTPYLLVPIFGSQRHNVDAINLTDFTRTKLRKERRLYACANLSAFAIDFYCLVSE